jgi:hypothetical protein
MFNVYTLHHVGPEASKEDISSMVIMFHWLIVALLVGWTRFYFFSAATTNDQGFSTYC